METLQEKQKRIIETINIMVLNLEPTLLELAYREILNLNRLNIRLKNNKIRNENL